MQDITLTHYTFTVSQLTLTKQEIGFTGQLHVEKPKRGKEGTGDSWMLLYLPLTVYLVLNKLDQVSECVIDLKAFLNAYKEPRTSLCCPQL